MSVRITAAGAVAVALFCYSTAPVSACDERYVKRCEKLSAAAALREESQGAPAVRRKSAGRVRMVVSVRAHHGRWTRRMHAPRFSVAKAKRGMVLASDNSRMTTLMPESAIARRFRGFIDPLPMSQNAFENLRKPHLVALNLEPAAAMPAAEQVASEKAESAELPANVAAPAKQDRIVAAPAAVDPVVSKPVALVEASVPMAKPVAIDTAHVPLPAAPRADAPLPATQAVVSESPMPAPADPQQSPFSVHKLVLALCGALGAAGALRFIVGA